MTKSLRAANKEPLHDALDSGWRSERIEFTYRNKSFSARIEDSLILKDLTPTEVKDHLNELPARFAYWKAFQVQVEREIADKEEDFEVWFAECYSKIDNATEKKTEAWKKNAVMLDNVEEYRLQRTVIKDLQDVNKKIAVLVAAYNTMTWTLREIARLTYAELSNIEAHGKGSFRDL